MGGGYALVWLGGNASTYEPVTYRLGAGREKSVLAAAALNSLLAGELGGFEKLLVLIPETLFPGNHCEAYRLLLEAKTGYQGKKLKRPLRGGFEDATRFDENVHQVLRQGFECRTVPHPGVASPLVLEEKGDTYIVSYGERRVYRRPFEAMLNTVYAALRGLASRGYSIVFDLTHGTNPLVSATLLSAAMLRSVYGPEGVETRLYMAPVMGKLGEDAEVEFIEMTGAAETVNTLASGINAWMMLDERLLPRDAVRRVGRSLGPRYNKVYGSLVGVVDKSSKLLWALRSGQVPVIPGQLDALRKLQDKTHSSLEELLQDAEGLAASEPWVPVADAVAVATKRLVHRLLKERNDETMIAALEELVRAGMPDRALGPARELVVALLVAKHTPPNSLVRVGDKEWENIARWLDKCAMSRHGKEPEDCGKLPLDREDLKVYDQARKLRNRLMHGRLSREEGAALSVLPGRDIRVVTVDEKRATKQLNPIELREAEAAAEGLLRVLGKLEKLRGAGR